MNAIKSFVQVDRPVGAVFLALLMRILAQHLFTQSAEVGSEIIAWATLPVLFKGFRRQNLTYSIKRNPKSLEFWSLSSMHLWVIAIGLCIYSWFKAEIGVLKAFVR